MTSTASKKRERDSHTGAPQHGPATPQAQEDSSSSTTNFRQVSACNRCRTRKNRCDQKLPRCTGCEKANVKCLGFDPVSKRAIPRSYVYYLETRVSNLESLLRNHNIPCPPPEDDFAISDAIQPGRNVPFPVLDEDPHTSEGAGAHDEPTPAIDPALQQRDEAKAKLERLVSDVGMVSVQGTSESRFLGSTSGISFARVVFAAVKSSVAKTPSEKGSRGPSKAVAGDAASGGNSSMRDSFFGLHTKPTIKPAPFPSRDVGHRLVELYFEYANPQIPILHRGEFERLVQRVYSIDAKNRTPRELYLLNIVFAIGSGIIIDSWGSNNEFAAADAEMDVKPPQQKRQKLDKQQYQPEEYHSSAVVHLESFLGSSPAAEGGKGGLEELQAVLLLASLALLRPVAPGLWYIVGVAVRLAVDLGLHSEDIEHHLDLYVVDEETEGARALGRKQWTRDLRRRLWWCVYTFDRLVSTCVGRPFGITDQVVTTEFPSMLDDKYITTDGFLKPPLEIEMPSYKLVARHYFRLRLLQSEILQVLQYRQAEKARMLGAGQGNEYIHKDMSSPFLHKFDSFRQWRFDIDRRLLVWKESAPEQPHTGVAFTPLFLELNYWQAIVTLYRQSLAVPEQLAGEVSSSTGNDVQSPGSIDREAKEDEQLVFMKVAQAGQMVLKLYRQLHRLKLVNYTFLATHHLFMSGISFLYAIWHSTLVRSQLSIDDVDFSVLSATSVLGDLAEKCPPAEACRDAFVRMSKATIAMVEQTTGFGSQSTLSSQPLHSPVDYFAGQGTAHQFPADGKQQQRPAKRRMTMPKFDMNLRDLFDDEELAGRPLQNQPIPQAFDVGFSEADHGRLPPLLTNQSPSNTNLYSNLQGSPAATYTSPSYGQNVQSTLSNQQPYVPFAQTISQTQPDFSFGDMSFLDSFTVSDPTPGSWGGWSRGGVNDLDLGFGTGGTATYDVNGEWDENTVDMFGGFFFGNEGGGGF